MSRLHNAIDRRSWTEVSALVRAGEDINVWTHQYPLTPLVSAIFSKAPINIIVQLISPVNINLDHSDTLPYQTALGSCPYPSYPPLDYAIRTGYWDLVSVLVSHGADIDSDSGMDRCPPLITSMVCTPTIPPDKLAPLISAANINKRVAGSEDPDTRFTALHVSLIHRLFSHAKVLLDHGADVNMKYVYNITPLLLGIYRPVACDDDLLLRLITPEVINVWATHFFDGVGTALLAAIKRRRWLIVRELLARGADVNVPTAHHTTALLLAVVQSAPMDVITQLITPSTINKANEEGHTPLVQAISLKRLDLVPLLVQHGAHYQLVLPDDHPQQQTLMDICVTRVRGLMTSLTDAAFESLPVTKPAVYALCLTPVATKIKGLLNE